MLNDEQLNQKLQASPEARVTKEDIEAHIVSTEFTKFSDTVTICNITLDNGYSVRGESACVNVDNYDQEIGETIAQRNAFNQLWPLYGFLLAHTQWMDANPQTQSAAA